MAGREEEEEEEIDQISKLKERIWMTGIKKKVQKNNLVCHRRVRVASGAGRGLSLRGFGQISGDFRSTAVVWSLEAAKAFVCIA